jgi:hypothetical protein
LPPLITGSRFCTGISLGAARWQIGKIHGAPTAAARIVAMGNQAKVNIACRKARRNRSIRQGSLDAHEWQGDVINHYGSPLDLSGGFFNRT